MHFVIHQVHFLKKEGNKKILVQNEQVKRNAVLLKAKCSRQEKTVAFGVELKIKAAPFQVELYCKLWIWGASSRAVFPRLHDRLAEWAGRLFSQKKPSRGLRPTLLAPCECIIQHQVVNKIQIRIKIKLEKKMHHLIIWTDCFDWETRCPWHKVKDLNQFYQWTYCYTFMHKS